MPCGRADGGRTHGMCLGVLTEVNLAQTPAGTTSTVTFALPSTGELRRRACARNPGHAPAKRLRLLQATRARRVGRCLEARRRRPHRARRPQLPGRPLHGRLSFQRPLRRRRNRRTPRPLPRRPLHSRLSFQRLVRRRRNRRAPHPLPQCHPETPPPSPRNPPRRHHRQPAAVCWKRPLTTSRAATAIANAGAEPASGRSSSAVTLQAL